VNKVAFDGLRFTDINHTIPPLTVTINPATNYAGFNASRISFSGDSLLLNLENLVGLQGQVISLDVRSITAIPEPSGFELFGTGVGFLSLWRIRRARLVNLYQRDCEPRLGAVRAW